MIVCCCRFVYFWRGCLFVVDLGSSGGNGGGGGGGFTVMTLFCDKYV